MPQRDLFFLSHRTALQLRWILAFFSDRVFTSTRKCYLNSTCYYSSTRARRKKKLGKASQLNDGMIPPSISVTEYDQLTGRLGELRPQHDHDDGTYLEDAPRLPKYQRLDDA